MRIDVVSIFPDYLAPLDLSLIGKARAGGLLDIAVHDLRDFARDRHHTVDDVPYGGGAGMVMKVDVLFRATETVYSLDEAPHGITLYEPAPTTLESEPPPIPQPAETPIILMSPHGRVFSHAVAEELARHPRLILLCGHYEGVDERVRSHLITDEISIGDYVLTGGELAAMVVADAVARQIPGVLSEGSAHDESHARGLLEYPQYTRPPSFRDWGIPPILVSGHHAQVEAWRRHEALRATLKHRPDLLDKADLTKQEQAWLEELGDGSDE